MAPVSPLREPDDAPFRPGEEPVTTSAFVVGQDVTTYGRVTWACRRVVPRRVRPGLLVAGLRARHPLGGHPQTQTNHRSRRAPIAVILRSVSVGRLAIALVDSVALLSVLRWSSMVVSTSPEEDGSVASNTDATLARSRCGGPSWRSVRVVPDGSDTVGHQYVPPNSQGSHHTQGPGGWEIMHPL